MNCAQGDGWASLAVRGGYAVAPQATVGAIVENVWNSAHAHQRCGLCRNGVEPGRGAARDSPWLRADVHLISDGPLPHRVALLGENVSCRRPTRGAVLRATPDVRDRRSAAERAGRGYLTVVWRSNASGNDGNTSPNSSRTLSASRMYPCVVSKPVCPAARWMRSGSSPRMARQVIPVARRS